MLQWSADVTEHAHITEIKKPARAGNNQNYYSQIAHHLDCTEKCTHFDVATRILSLHEGVRLTSGEDEDHEHKHKHKPDEELDIDSCFPSLTHMVINYFNVASSLNNGNFPNSPKPFRTFASSTAAVNVVVKPSLRMSFNNASDLFQIPNLHPAICEYFYRSARGEAHKISGHRHANARCDVPVNGLQIRSKIQVQQRTFHDLNAVEPPQTLVISPPSQHDASGTYDFAIVSPTADSDWPLNGLNGMSSYYCLLDLLISMILGHFVVQLHLVFCILGTDTFLAYVQCLNATAPDAASGLHGLKHMVRTNDTCIGDIIPLAHICSPAHV